MLCNLFCCDDTRQISQKNSSDPATKDTLVQTRTLKVPVSSLEQSLMNAGLVDIQSLDSSIQVDLKYSSTDNFVGVDVYGQLEKCYLQREVAEKVVEAQRFLQEKKPGYSLLIFDGARPLSVQQIFWDTLAKPDHLKHLYVADPREGSIHNFGSAVDLTIADAQGQALDMGTPYDFFGELAYPSKEEDLLQQGALTGQQVANRQLLREIMALAGFTPINTEWWHFNAYSRKKAEELYRIIP